MGSKRKFFDAEDEIQILQRVEILQDMVQRSGDIFGKKPKSEQRNLQDFRRSCKILLRFICLAEIIQDVARYWTIAEDLQSKTKLC